MRRSLLPAALALIALACDRPPPPAAPLPAIASSAPAPPLPPAPPPEPPAIDALDPILALPVEGFGAAVVSLPVGARARRPVVIAAHGNYDRPEWQCEIGRQIVGDSAFVLCPRGVPRPDSPSADDLRFTYESNQRLERELDAALTALRARFPDHADVDRPIYTGFSLGAIMGVAIAVRNPGRFPRLVLVEGGHDKWTPGAAAAFAKGGGERVLFVCAQSSCAADARRAASRLQRAGVAVRVARGPEAGHRYDGPIAVETRKGLPWVLEGDARWDASGLAPGASGAR